MKKIRVGALKSCLAALCLIAASILIVSSAEAKPKKLWFNTLVAHWSDYSDPGYLDFLKDAQPEIAQVGFYGVTFYSLVHTPFGSGYPAHMPVQGVEEGGRWFANLNREIHKRKVKVVGHFNTTFIFGEPTKNAGFFQWYNDMWDEKVLGPKPARDPVEMLQKDINGKPISSPTYGIGGWPEYHGCLNNPKWRACLKPMVKMAIARGVDGLIANYFYRGDCLCEYCQAGFRTYLASHYSAEKLRDKMGITDIKIYSFTSIPSWHDPATTDPYKIAALTWTQISLKQAYDDVFINYGRKLKPDLIIAQWNHLGDFQQISGDERAVLPGELWGKGEDYLWYSTGNVASQTNLGKDDLGDGTLQLRYIRGAFGPKPYLLGKYESTRTRVTIAEGVANGGAGLGFYAPFKDPVGRAGLVSYFRFLRSNRKYYEDASPAGELLLLYPRSAVHKGDVTPIDRFRKLGKRLVREQYAFDILPDDLLTPERLEGYSAIAYCEDASLSATAQQAIAKFKGPRLLAKTDEWPEKFQIWKDTELVDFTKLSGSSTVVLSLMKQPKAQRLLVHLVNYNRREPPQGVAPAGRGPQDEQTIAVKNTQVRLRIPSDLRVKNVRLLTPDGAIESTLTVQKQENGFVTFTVPSILVYSVAVVELQR